MATDELVESLMDYMEAAEIHPGTASCPFDSTDKALACSGYYFSETGAGPFESYSAMADWFDHLRYSLLVDLHMNYGSFKPHLYPMFDASHPPVLCHMDLNMRNIIVDKRGDVWLVDWGMAGAFPP
ncbi:uncharacterized protein EV420DRAFT_1651585 [Desarmillaria tabescens]|uniref:Aminoglycoside phosphotransferase domain-containing protein n=1 Tax=Armillaria tabescens TaxID=1929756 RepID=A0AA39MLS8_ARMTA|nr:uncharacterized protein EV420DRAFT_1651585 [Desarmillaria tabescens]KAK0438140.1 hypothetical protein EV420DRAFT_1651585 [Desarmillaria tabescens]